MHKTATSTHTNTQPSPGNYVLEAKDLVMQFGQRRVLDEISLKVKRGEILGIVGGSGSGKSTLMRNLAMLQVPTAGSVRVLGTDIFSNGDASTFHLRSRLGVMFQHGALFSDLTTLDNVSLPLREHTDLSPHIIEEIAMLKIALTGLRPDAAALLPSQLSGGMRKRAAVARGIALDPEILFLDEPGSGLDPISADGMDDLILQLKATLGLTVILVTHDMHSLWRVTDRVILLANAKIEAEGTFKQLAESDNEIARKFFNSRSRGSPGTMQ